MNHDKPPTELLLETLQKLTPFELGVICGARWEDIRTLTLVLMKGYHYRPTEGKWVPLEPE